MKASKKLLALLLSLVMIIAMMVPAMAAEEDIMLISDEVEVPSFAVPADVEGKLVIIHTNDTHGHDVAVEGETIGTAGVAALKKEFEAAGASVLLVSAGDFSQGTTLVSLDKGASAIKFMNAAGYDVAAPGNHEFDYKMDALNANIEAAEFPVLAANIVVTETGKALFGDHVTFDTAIGKVGVFGLDTPETMTKAHPDNVKGLTFYMDDELVACAQAEVDALKADGCEYIVALCHLGVDAESEPNRSTDVFAKVTGVDLVIDGHSHTEMSGEDAKTAGDAVVVSTGQYLDNVGVVITDGIDTTACLVTAAEWTKVDEAVAEVVNTRDAEVKAELEKTFATTEVLLNGERAPGNRTEETNLGDFAADAMLWSARQSLGEDAADIAITNGGGIRATIQPGEVTMNDMKTVFPFGNTVATLDLTGAELLEALEASTYSTPGAVGAFPQVSGIEFVIDTTKAFDEGDLYPDSTYHKPNSINRVTITSVGGNEFDPEANYTIVTNDFMAAGGDVYGVFIGKKVFDTTVALEDALVNYTREVLNNAITAEQYGEPQGRITIIKSAVDTFDDVTADDWFADAVNYVFANKLMDGTDKGFEPSANLSKAQVLQILYNLAGTPEVTADAEPWYAAALAWAGSEGIVDADSFAEGDITRGETIEYLTKYFAKQNLSINGLFKGDGEGNLNLDQNLNRAEMATVLTRIPELKELGTETLTTKVIDLGKYGNASTDIKMDAFTAAGFTVGDMIKVEITDVEEALVFPYGTGYSNVDQGDPIALANKAGTLDLALSRSDFGTKYGLGVKGEDGVYTITEGKTITISMAEKGAYLKEMELRDIDSKRTNVREDYDSDEVFANFREIKMGDIAEGVLYRTSSPVNPELGRSTYADKFVEANGVKTVVNLADSQEVMEGYEGYADTYYSTLNVLPLNMGVDMQADDAKAKLKDAFEFMIANEGPYAFHCKEGKDRAGYFAIVLEALMGGTKDEIVADYMVTYENYYHVEKDSEQWTGLAQRNVIKDLMKLAGVETEEELAEADLAAAVETYLTEEIGLTAEQVTALKGVLSTPVAAEEAEAA